jgi:hypothetical protein
MLYYTLVGNRFGGDYEHLLIAHGAMLLRVHGSLIKYCAQGTLSVSVSLSLTHSLSLFLAFFLSHTLSLSLSVSLSLSIYLCLVVL